MGSKQAITGRDRAAGLARATACQRDSGDRQCSTLKPVLTGMKGRINTLKQLRGSARDLSFGRAESK
jgi:hypothetical protein